MKNGIFNGMISVNIVNKLSTLRLFSHSIIMVYGGIDSQTDKLGEFEFSCGNTSSKSIMWNNFNRIRSASIIATFYLGDTNWSIQFMNGSGSNIIELIKFDANIVAVAELVLNLAVYLSIDTVGCVHK